MVRLINSHYPAAIDHYCVSDFLMDSYVMEGENIWYSYFIKVSEDYKQNKRFITDIIDHLESAAPDVFTNRPMLEYHVDLYLSDDNYEKAKAFLAPLASEIEKEYVREKHLGMTIDGWVIELHGSLYCGLSSKIERELDKVHQDTFYGGSVRSWYNNGTQVFLLKAENDVFYEFTHILQHFYKEGVGLRHVCD